MRLPTIDDLLFWLQSAFVAARPLLIGLIILLLGWILARIFARLTRRLSKKLGVRKLHKYLEQVPFVERLDIQLDKLLGKIIFWVVLLFAITTAAETAGLEPISQLINDVIAFLPQVFAAMVFLVVGLFLASLVRNLVGTAARSFGIGAWKAIGSVVFGILAISVVLTTLEQLGLPTALLSDIVRILLAAVALAFAIGYGFASRNVLASLITGLYRKYTYQVGMDVEVRGHRGTIVFMDGVSFTLDTGDAQVVMPLNFLLNEAVVIRKQAED